MSYTTIHIDTVSPGLKRLTLNRPETLNALSLDMLDELLDALGGLQRDTDCRVLILTGAGKGFCSGIDLGEMKAMMQQPDYPAAFWQLQKKVSNIIQLFRAIPQPVIAAVNGAACGGGLALTLCCDIRVAIPRAKFIASFINVGMTASDMGVSYFLPRLIGQSRASEIMLTGRTVSGTEAEEIGLAAKTVAEEQLSETVMQYANALLEKSDWGLRLTKEALNSSMSCGSLADQIHIENRNQYICATSGDFADGAARFFKR